MNVNKIRWFLLLIGGGIIGAAFFAEAIGLDNDPGWGKGRIAILVFGVLIIAWVIFQLLYTDVALSVSGKIQSILTQSVTVLIVFVRRYWYTFPILILVIAVYVWFASSGSWVKWEPATRYFAELANSFKRGKLHLLDKPDSNLLSMSDPYDPVARDREGVNFFIDYSLYKGKYYLYWGPVPAFILMLVDPFTHGRVGDLYLVFTFVCGIFLLEFLFIIFVWDRFFRDLPKWILSLSMLVVGLMIPWTYMLVNEPNGRVYEAAISIAQFFLLGGIVTVVIAFRKFTLSWVSLLLIGSLWALSIGTRLVLVVPIGLLMLMIAYRIWKTRPSWMSFALQLISLGLPVVLGLIYLGWYNWARFGSVTETGFSYALAGVNLQDDHNSLFSPIYLVENVYIYLLQPPSGTAQFPFFYPTEISAVTGLMFVAPFTLFSIIAITSLFLKPTPKTLATLLERNELNGIKTTLLIAFFSAFLMLLVFFWSAMRYLGDLMPTLAMLSVLGFWQGYQLLDQKPRYQRFYLILGLILAIVSITMSILFSLAVKNLGRTGF